MRCLFCDFISGRKYHNDDSPNGKYPLIPVFENKQLFAFLSHPDNHLETHLLVIPKKHYEFLEDVPSKELCALINLVSEFSKTIRQKYGGCKIVQNNGKHAQQYIGHVHFHLIPMKNEKILWLNLSQEKFTSLSISLKKSLNSIQS